MKCIAWIVAAGIVVAGLGAGPVSAQTRLPSRTRVDDLPAAAVLTLDVGGVTNCSVVLTGQGVFQTDGLVKSPTNDTARIEIVSLDLSGVSPTLGPVRLVAGSNTVGQASVGLLAGTSSTNDFPATSFYDVFFQLQTAGGTNLINQQALRVAGTAYHVPATSVIHTNVGQVELVDAANPGTVVARVVQAWIAPGDKGTGKKKGHVERVGHVLSFSADVVGNGIPGTNGTGQVDLQVCPSNSEQSVVAVVQGTELAGALTSNLACDETIDTNLLFEAKWDGSFRAPDWRGSHSGNWVIYQQDAKGNLILVAFGTMSGSNGAGSDRPPISTGNNPCQICGHFEGSLSGRIIQNGPLKNARIHASYTGEYLDSNGIPLSCCPPPSAPPAGAFRMALEGVTVLPQCLPLAGP